MPDDSSLLSQYVRERSQDAFAQIVRQYIDIVYASARRQVHDADLAQDVTQAVFIVLSQKAAVVPADRPLSAWLLATTRYCAANARRVRENRELHERRAAQMARTINEPERADSDYQALRPLLDEGLSKLGAGERNALVLKYFEKKTLRQVGDALGISEEAATKRVNRAVEKLRVFFRRRQTIAGAAAVVALLSAESSQAAPASVAAAIVASSESTSAAGTIAKGAILMMAIEKAKLTAVAAAVLLIGLGGGAVAVRQLTAHATADRTAQAATTAVAVATRPSAVTFSDGATVQLVGMTEIDPGPRTNDSLMGKLTDLLSAAPARRLQPPNSRAPIWWAADGSIVPESSIPAIDLIDVPTESDHRTLGFIFSARVSKPTDADATFQVQWKRGRRHISVRQDGTINLAVTAPRDLDRADIRIGKSIGPWQKDAVTPISTSREAVPRGPSFVASIADSGNETVVQLGDAFWSSDRETRIVAVKKDGNGVEMKLSKPVNGQEEGRFGCPLKDVDHIVALSRPYEWVTLNDVALKPPPDEVRKIQHAFALAHPQIIRDRAQELFDAIRNADYSDPGKLADLNYQVNNARPDWSKWVCENFQRNPIQRLKLGEVRPGTGNYQGWPTIPYVLTLKDGSTISDPLPFYFSPDQSKWIPCEGLDWHLWRRDARREPTQQN